MIWNILQIHRDFLPHVNPTSIYDSLILVCSSFLNTDRDINTQVFDVWYQFVKASSHVEECA